MTHTFTLRGAPRSGTNSKRVIQRGGRRFHVPSKAAVEWRDAMIEQLIAQKPRGLFLTKDVTVTLHVYRARASGDLDNFVKPVFDALTRAQVWADDALVTALHLFGHVDRANPRVELEITLTRSIAA